MNIKFWGTRGSIPTPSTAEFVTSRYGGNTTCVSVWIPGRLIILDAGSGLRNLGLHLAREMPIAATFFFTHVHWDHIQGFPFFPPNFFKGNAFDLYGASYEHDTGVVGSVLENALRGQQRSLNFPIRVSDMPADLNFKEITPGASVTLKGRESELVVTAGELNHPGGCLGYRIEEHRVGDAGKQSAAFVFATDTEHREQLDPNLQRLAKGADVLVYDAQYSMDEYEGRSGGPPRKGWGHSTWFHGMREAHEAGVKHLLLTHHDPMHDDWAIARIENLARKECSKLKIEVNAVKEGMELRL